jgi:hypothetical protein
VDAGTSEEEAKDIPSVQAEDHGIAVGEISVSGNIGGDIRIGLIIGYTSEQVFTQIKAKGQTARKRKRFSAPLCDRRMPGFS